MVAFLYLSYRNSLKLLFSKDKVKVGFGRKKTLKEEQKYFFFQNAYEETEQNKAKLLTFVIGKNK